MGVQFINLGDQNMLAFSKRVMIWSANGMISESAFA